MGKHFLVILFSLLYCFSVKSQSIIKLDDNDYRYFGKRTSVLEDKNRTWKIDDILARSNQFKPVKQEVFYPNFTTSAYWIKFQLKDLSNEPCYLEVDNPSLDSITLFIVNGNKVEQIKQTGAHYSFAQRDVLTSNFIFKIEVPKDETRTIYIRYVSSSDAFLPLTLGRTESLVARTAWMDMIFGFIYGVLFVTVLYNLILFIRIKDRSYLFYIGYIFCFLLLKLKLGGHLLQFVFPNFPSINTFISYFAFSATAIFMTCFALEFLKIKSISPKLFYLGRIFSIAFAMVIAFSFFNRALSMGLSSILLILIAPYFLLLGIISYKNGYKPALYYLIASSGLLLSIVAIGTRSFGFISYSFFYRNAVSFALTLEAILLSMALGDKYDTLKKANEEAQQKLNKELELKIEERTKAQEELNKINQDLIQSNAALDNFIYTASHDLKTPVMNIEGLISILKEQRENLEENKEVLEMMNTSVSKFNSIINDLTDVAKIQRLSAEDEIMNDLSDTIKKAIHKLESKISSSNASVDYDFSQCPKIRFSKSYFSIILENLLSNAIKFQSKERIPKTTIRSFEEESFNVLEITDNGIGINKGNKEKVFLMFKRAHGHTKGRGIGLYIVKRIMENAGGRIELESEEGMGSTFRLYFQK